MLPAGCCFDLSSCATCYFWANTLNQGVAGEKPGEHLFWPPRPILSILWQAGGGQAAIIGGRRQKGCHCLSCHRKLLHLYHLQCFIILCLNCGELCCTLMMPFLNPSTLKSDPPSLSFPPFSKRGEKPFCHNYCAEVFICSDLGFPRSIPWKPNHKYSTPVQSVAQNLASKLFKECSCFLQRASHTFHLLLWSCHLNRQDPSTVLASASARQITLDEYLKICCCWVFELKGGLWGGGRSRLLWPDPWEHDNPTTWKVPHQTVEAQSQSSDTESICTSENGK